MFPGFCTSWPGVLPVSPGVLPPTLPPVSPGLSLIGVSPSFGLLLEEPPSPTLGFAISLLALPFVLISLGFFQLLVLLLFLIILYRYLS